MHTTTRPPSPFGGPVRVDTWASDDVLVSFWLPEADDPISATVAVTFPREDGLRVAAGEVGYDASVQVPRDVGFAAMVQGF